MNFQEYLKDAAEQFGVVLTEKMLRQFDLYFQLLVEWNEKMNLTAITEDREVMTKHFLDCMTINKALNMSEDYSVIDIGTGAGFPGLVIKIAFPHLKVTLVDYLIQVFTKYA